MADTKTIMTDVEGRMQRAIDHLEEELNNVRAGKASPNVLNGVMVDYYGSMTPVSGVASVTVPDAKTILIQPWDKKMIKPIEKAIIDSNIGLTPSNNGEQILLSIPPLTEERRKLLVKQIRQEAETARVSLRNARRDAVEAFRRECPKTSRKTAKRRYRNCWRSSPKRSTPHSTARSGRS